MKIPGNPFALITNQIVTEVVYMQNYSKKEIDNELKNHKFDSYVDCSSVGEEFFIGQEVFKGRPRSEKPFSSWTFNEDDWIWEAPVKKPEDDKFYYWDERIQQWKSSTDCCPE